MHLYLARHGQTEWNAQRRIQGWGDSPLTDIGKKQAKSLAQQLKGVRLDDIYCSDSGRACETASFVGKQQGLTPKPMADLREWGWGDWEGMCIDDITAKNPELWAQYIASVRAADENPDDRILLERSVVPNGELAVDAQKRIEAALAKIMVEHPGEDDAVLVVGHNGSARIFLCLALDLPLGRARRFALDNAALAHIVFSAKRSPIVICINDHGYFGEAPPTDE